MLRRFSRDLVLGDEGWEEPGGLGCLHDSGLKWIEAEHHEFLRARKRGQHLSQQDRVYLSGLLLQFPEWRHQVRRLYKLSNSTCRRLIEYSREQNQTKTEDGKFEWSLDDMKKDIKDLILESVGQPQPPITIDHIRRKIKQEFNVHCSHHFIRKVMKQELKLSYKKG